MVRSRLDKAQVSDQSDLKKLIAEFNAERKAFEKKQTEREKEWNRRSAEYQKTKEKERLKWEKEVTRKQKLFEDQERTLKSRTETVERAKQSLEKDRRKNLSLKRDLDSQKASVQEKLKSIDNKKKLLSRKERSLETAQKSLLAKIEPWKSKIKALRRVREDIRKETKEMQTHHSKEVEEKMNGWEKCWADRNTKLQAKNKALNAKDKEINNKQKALDSREADLRSLEDRLKEQEKRITDSRIDEREAELRVEKEKFEERKSRLGEWESVQLQKMADYERKMAKLSEKETEFEERRRKLEEREQDFEMNAENFLNVVQQFSITKKHFESDRNEFSAWRSKETERIESMAASMREKLDKVEKDTRELEKKRATWVANSRQKWKKEQEKEKVAFAKTVRKRESEMEMKLQLKQKQLEADMRRSVKRKRAELQRRADKPEDSTNHHLSVRSRQKGPGDLETKKLELEKVTIELETKKKILLSCEADTQIQKNLELDAKMRAFENEMLEARAQIEAEKEKSLRESGEKINAMRESMREELQIEMYSKMDDARAEMEAEVKQEISDKLELTEKSLEQYLSFEVEAFKPDERVMKSLQLQFQLQRAQAHLWLEKERSELHKQRKELDDYVATTQQRLKKAAEKVETRELDLRRLEQELTESKDKLLALKKQVETEKKDLNKMKQHKLKDTLRLDVSDAQSVKSYAGPSRKFRSSSRSGRTKDRRRVSGSQDRDDVRSMTSGRTARSAARSPGGGKSPVRRSTSRSRYRKPDVLETCPICKEQYMTSEMRDHAVTHPTEIKPCMWLGNAVNAHDIPLLKSIGITHILNCAKEIEPQGEDQEFVYKHLDLVDKSWEDITTSFDGALEFMFEAVDSGGKIFVHCQQGVSRSASFCCAFFIKRDKISLDGALAILSCKRHIVQPNSGFLRQLREFETKVMKEKRRR